MINRTTFFGMALLLSSAFPRPILAEETRRITLGDLPLLFVDDSGVQAATGVIRTIHPATRRETPAMQPDKPWEGTRLYLYGSIYPDPITGDYRMWYMSHLASHGSDFLLYATSTDGLAWTRPALKLFEYAGSVDNNIIFPLVSPSVIFDRMEKDPAKRYKMLGGKSHYEVFYSADGLNWKKYADAPGFSGGDTHTLAQDPVTGAYLLYHKRDRTIRGRIRRTVFVSVSSDFQHWSPAKLALAADVEDDAWAKELDEHTQIYSMSVFPHAGGFIGMPAMFHVTHIGQRTPGRSGQDGPLDVQLATSADGLSWQRTTPRLTIIPRGTDGAYDGGAILGVANTLVYAGDKTCVYYTAMNTTHGAAVADKRFTLGRAEWPRDRFASLDAGGSARIDWG